VQNESEKLKGELVSTLHKLQATREILQVRKYNSLWSPIPSSEKCLWNLFIYDFCPL